MNLHDTLLKKASADTLGHFYIIETPVSEDLAHEILVNFIHSFIQDYFQKIEGHKQSLLNLMDHPDVFILGNLPGQNEKSDKLFKVDFFCVLTDFQPKLGNCSILDVLDLVFTDFDFCVEQATVIIELLGTLKKTSKVFG